MSALAQARQRITCPAVRSHQYTRSKTGKGAHLRAASSSCSSRSRSASPLAPGLCAGTYSRSKYRWHGRRSRTTCEETCSCKCTLQIHRTWNVARHKLQVDVQ